MRTFTSFAATLLLLLGATGAGADDRTTEAGEADIADPVAECAPYSYTPVFSSLSSFPANWKNVTSVPANDTVARAKFLAMNSSIPNIPIKGTLKGDFTNFTPTYATSDPDCWWTFHQCVTPKLTGLTPDLASVPEPRTLGFGFDDGPNCSHNAFYDYLTEQEQKATMFFIGSNVQNWPLEAQRAVADGHEICVHTWSHPYMTATTNEGAFAELWYTMQIIKLVTGVTPTCWRPPFGDVDDRIRYIASQLGLETVLWEYNANDWEVGLNGVTEAQVQANYDALVASAGSGAFDSVGAIILTHELNNYTMQTAIDNYPKLAAAFDHIVPIAVAQNKTQPYVESTVTMQSFSSYIANHTTKPPVGSNSSAGSGSGSGSNGTTGASTGVTLRVSRVALQALVLGAAVLYLCL
ncbi:carbohydrate esterase family 4 protein [Mycena epipterygia]|nr:carbohydrate esterase family 4 protein [Mycena epipterygia]